MVSLLRPFSYTPVWILLITAPSKNLPCVIIVWYTKYAKRWVCRIWCYLYRKEYSIGHVLQHNILFPVIQRWLDETDFYSIVFYALDPSNNGMNRYYILKSRHNFQYLVLYNYFQTMSSSNNNTMVVSKWHI